MTLSAPAPALARPAPTAAAEPQPRCGICIRVGARAATSAGAPPAARAAAGGGGELTLRPLLGKALKLPTLRPKQLTMGGSPSRTGVFQHWT